MIIKNKEEFLQYKSTLSSASDKTIRLLIGMGTCGIAAGAKETMDAINSSLKENGLTDVETVGVGCVGFCCMEPTVEIIRKGKEPMLYGPINKDMADELVQTLMDETKVLDSSFYIETYGKVGE